MFFFGDTFFNSRKTLAKGNSYVFLALSDQACVSGALCLFYSSFDHSSTPGFKCNSTCKSVDCVACCIYHWKNRFSLQWQGKMTRHQEMEFNWIWLIRFQFYAKESVDRERSFSVAVRIVSLFSCLSRLAPSVTSVCILARFFRWTKKKERLLVV